MINVVALTRTIGLVAVSAGVAGAQCMGPTPAGFDFAAAPNTAFETDFSDAQGSAPPKGIRFVSGGLTMADREGKRAIMGTSRATILVPTPPLGEDFSIEIGLVHRATRQIAGPSISVYGGRAENFYPGTSSLKFEYGTVYWQARGGGTNTSEEFSSEETNACVGAPTTFRLQGAGADVKAYAGARLLTYLQEVQFNRTGGVLIEVGGGTEENVVYITSIRIAGAGPVVVAGQLSPTAPTSAVTSLSSRVIGDRALTTDTVASARTLPVNAGASTRMQPPQTIEAPTEAAADARRVATLTPAARASRQASAAVEPSDPTAVHATGLTVFAGYDMNILRWNPVASALGHRIARASWNNGSASWVPDSDVEFPAEPVGAVLVHKKAAIHDENMQWVGRYETTYVATGVQVGTDTIVVAARDILYEDTRWITTVTPAGVIRDSTFVDASATAGTQYVYWLDTYFRSSDGTLYAPPGGPYPTVTATPRDAGAKNWLPSEADRATPPQLVSVSASADGIQVQWATKGGAVAYAVFRTRRGDDLYALEEGGKCYPYILDRYIVHSPTVSINVPSTQRRFCIGIFAIYPETIIDGTPGSYGFAGTSFHAFFRHHARLEQLIHSKGLFLWAEWDEQTGTWKLLPQGSFNVNPCITGSYATATFCY